MNEWELLVAAEDIEPGDTLEVDEEGDTILMVFNHYTKGIVYCTGEEGLRRKFRGSSLEEIDGSAFIIQKSDEELSL